MNINTILRKDLLDTRITSLLGGNYVYKLHKDESEKHDIYVEYMIIREKEKSFAGNTNLSNEYLIQIDVFSKNGALVSKVMKKIKEVLKEKDYSFSYGTEGYESETSLYTEKIRVYKEVFNI